MSGFFGFFDYSKPGPGVSKDAPPKHRFFVFFEVFSRKFWKLMQLNILYVISCIPIITIGPATAGFTYVLRNFSREEHAWVFSDFMEHARKNFRQAFLVSLIGAIAIYIAYVNFMFYSQPLYSDSIIGYLKYFVIIVGVIFAIMHFYIYPMMVTFKLSIKQIYKNAFIFAMAKLPRNILMVVFLAVATYGFYYYYIIGLILTPFIVISALGLIVNFFVYPVMKEYMIDKVEGNIENEATEMVGIVREKVFKE